MAKLFSFASWNVEHFRGEPARAHLVVDFIKQSSPDVFALMEVERRDVFDQFMAEMPTHSFFITEDFSQMETLVGVNRDFQSFVTQRQDLKSQIPTLRPGAMVTLNINQEAYTLLFLHLKSFPDPRSWGLRSDMIDHCRKLKTALDGKYGTPTQGANFICMGDLNTMGMNVTYAGNDVTGAEELERIKDMFNYNRMALLDKTHDNTWWNGNGDESTQSSNLDHVFASRHLPFNVVDGAQVSVRGWPTLANATGKRDWIDTHSDHALIYGEVQA